MICHACGHPNDDPGSETCFGCGQPLAPSAVIRQGSVVGSRYEILSLLGRGGMGVVYRARDRVLDEVVALKVLRLEGDRSEDLARRFLSEIKLARRVTHPNVCRIHDYGEEPGLSYISMELLQGTDLRKLLGERGPLPSAEAYAITAQVADGLQAIHAEGIVHRDLKSPNIMIGASGAVKLMDFGIAKQVRGGGGDSVTATGHVVGTPEYMSPEQARGHDVDSRSDIYALGVVAFETFTGRVPFRGKTPIETILMHIHDPPPLEGPDATGIPASLLPVLRRTLAKEPGDRFASAAEAGSALRAAAREDASSTPPEAWTPTMVDTPVSTTATTANQLRARRSSVLPLWLLSVAVVALAGGIFLRTNRATAPPLTSATAPSSLLPSVAPSLAVPIPVTTPPSLAPVPPSSLAASAPAPAPARTVVPSARPVVKPSPSLPGTTLAAAVPSPARTPSPPPTRDAARERVEAAQALASRGSAAVPQLVELLRDKDASVRRAAVRSILALGRPASVSPLLVAALVAALRDEDDEVRDTALEALSKLGSGARSAVPALKALRDRSKQTNPFLSERIDDALKKIKG